MPEYKASCDTDLLILSLSLFANRVYLRKIMVSYPELTTLFFYMGRSEERIKEVVYANVVVLSNTLEMGGAVALPRVIASGLETIFCEICKPELGLRYKKSVKRINEVVYFLQFFP
jgi:hypothetical protein